MNTECIEWPAGRNSRGYGVKWDGARAQLAHRMAWISERGPIPPGLCVLHRCDNPPCVNVEHLYLGTKADNARDRSARKRHRDDRGEKHPGAKLTEKKVLKIRARLASGEGCRNIARDFHVTPQMIRRIDRRLAWRHI